MTNVSTSISNLTSCLSLNRNFPNVYDILIFKMKKHLFIHFFIIGPISVVLLDYSQRQPVMLVQL